MKSVNAVQEAWTELEGLSLVGIAQWERGIKIAKSLIEIKRELIEEEKRQEEAYQASIEEARKRREQAKKEAAERGEEIIGGETVRINADGTQEVLIP